MAKKTSKVKIDPSKVSVDPGGKVTITDPKLAAAFKKALAGKLPLKPIGTGAFLDVNFGC